MPAHIILIRNKLQLRISFMINNIIRIITARDHLQKQLFRNRRSAYMDFLRPYAENGSRPIASPVLVIYHLRFIDHCNIINLFQIQNLDGRSLTEGSRRLYPLFSRDHIAGNARCRHRVVNLQRQKPQRPEINPLIRLFEALQGLICLTAVGRPDVQNEMPPHAARLRILLLRFRFHQFFDPLADHELHIVVFIDLI